MARKRNYKAEYARRMQGHKGEGLTKAQLGGHPRKKFGEPSITELREEAKQHPSGGGTRRNYYRELVEKHHGIYHGPSQHKSEKGYHSATFGNLDDALNFSSELPPFNKAYIKQFGYLKRDSPPKPEDVDPTWEQTRGEYRWRSITQLMTPGKVASDRRNISSKSSALFGNGPSEFTVMWKTMKAENR